MWQRELENLLVGVAVGVIVTFLAWLRRKYEINAMKRRECHCPHCGHVHYVPIPPDRNPGGQEPTTKPEGK